MMEANDLCFDVIMAGPMYQINLATTEMLYEKSDIPVMILIRLIGVRPL